MSEVVDSDTLQVIDELNKRWIHHWKSQVFMGKRCNRDCKEFVESEGSCYCYRIRRAVPKGSICLEL